MQWQLSLSVMVEAGTALGILIVGVCFPWRDISRRANLIGSGLLVITALWILTHSMEIGTPVASYKAYLMGLQLIWGLLALTLWLSYIIHYTTIVKWQTGRIYALFSIMPLLAILALATNYVYGLMWTAPGLDVHNPYLPLKPAYGPLYWASLVYMGALSVSGCFLILKKVFRQPNFRRWEPWTLILAAVIPLIVAFLEVTGFTLSAGLTVGLTPFFSGIGSIVVVLSLPRFHLQKVIPVARNTVFEQIGDGVVVLNMQNRVVDLNPAAERLAGYASSEALGLPVEQIWTSWPGRLVLSTPASTVFEELVLTRAGEQRTYILHLYTITDQKNRALNKIVLLIDITEHKKAEMELREQRWRLQNIIESTYVGTWEWNVQTGETVFNKIWAQIVGYTLDELSPISIRTWESLVHPEDGRKSEELLERHFSGELPYYDLECRMKHKDGHWVWVQDRGRVITRTSDGKPLMMFGTHTDITERKLAESKTIELEALKRTSQAKSELLANVSHELRTPLASIKGFIETLIETDVKWSKQQQLDFLQSADKETDRLTFLIRDLLDMSRIESGKMVLDKRSYLVSEILDSASGVLSVIAVKHKLKISSFPDLPPLQVDKVRIGQVITNLVENATKFSTEGSPIVIEVKADGDRAIFSVEDQGEGISQEVVDNLFSRFFQAERVVSGKTKGTGLGLAICKGIVEAHGGKIWVESREGQGSKFSFSIPATSPG
jgi:PAS domain S-box-containing protein